MANKICQFCRSTVLLEATVCRFCQREIDTAEGIKARALANGDRRPIFVVAIACIVGFAIFSQSSKEPAPSKPTSAAQPAQPVAQTPPTLSWSRSPEPRDCLN